jgi:hypothetical protein
VGRLAAAGLAGLLGLAWLSGCQAPPATPTPDPPTSLPTTPAGAVVVQIVNGAQHQEGPANIGLFGSVTKDGATRAEVGVGLPEGRWTTELAVGESLDVPGWGSLLLLEVADGWARFALLPND